MRTAAMVPIALMLVSLASPAAAAGNEYARHGVYVSAGGLYAIENVDSPGASSVDDSWGWEGRVGYRFFSNAAAELNFQYYDKFDVDPGNSKDGFSLTANGKFYLGAGKFQPYLMAGVGFSRVEGLTENDTGAVLRLGAGADAYLTKNVALYAELSADVVGEFRANPFTFGLQYRF